MTLGYHGSYLRIDLSTGGAHRVFIPHDVLERYLGGVGLGTWICANEGGAAHDPLSPPAPLILCLSPLVGTPLTTSAKFAVVARSPLTGYICDAISSSHFAIAAKRAGYDAFAIVGRAPGLSRLVVDDGRVEVHEEGGLRGRPASECGLKGFRTAAIGPAGERLVRYAMITNDGRHAGRGGLGAIMGAKNLKAFSVRGTQHVMNNRGYSRFLAGSLASAETDLKEAIRLGARDGAWTNLGKVQARQARYADALENFLQEMDLPHAYNLLGEAAMGRNDYDQARKYFESANHASPVYFEAAQKNIGIVSERSKAAAGTAAASKTLVVFVDTNIRADGTIIGVVRRGDRVQVLDTTRGWSRIRIRNPDSAEDLVGWVPSTVLTERL